MQGISWLRNGDLSEDVGVDAEQVEDTTHLGAKHGEKASSPVQRIGEDEGLHGLQHVLHANTIRDATATLYSKYGNLSVFPVYRPCQ